MQSGATTCSNAVETGQCFLVIVHFICCGNLQSSNGFPPWPKIMAGSWQSLAADKVEVADRRQRGPPRPTSQLKQTPLQPPKLKPSQSARLTFAASSGLLASASASASRPHRPQPSQLHLPPQRSQLHDPPHPTAPSPGIAVFPGLLAARALSPRRVRRRRRSKIAFALLSVKRACHRSTY